MVAPFVEGFLAKSFSPSVNQGIVLLGKNNLDLRTRGSPKKNWLVVFTILNNISQWEGLSHILWKIIQMFQTTNQLNIFTSSIPQ